MRKIDQFHAIVTVRVKLTLSHLNQFQSHQRINFPNFVERLDQLCHDLDRPKSSTSRNYRYQSRPFCSYCRTSTHSLQECWRKPEKGKCFDCLQFGCRRGNPRCPGKVNPCTVKTNASGNTVPKPSGAGGTNEVRTKPELADVVVPNSPIWLGHVVTSPVIQINVNSKSCTAILDTGSGVTLIKRSTVYRLGLNIDRSRCLPSLTAVNGEPLKVLGMTKVEIQIGDQENFSLYIPVVPDCYLSRDLLLGCDVIQRSTLTWDPRQQVMLWGGTAYHVSHVKTTKTCIQRICTPKASNKPSEKRI